MIPTNEKKADWCAAVTMTTGSAELALSLCKIIYFISLFLSFAFVWHRSAVEREGSPLAIGLFSAVVSGFWDSEFFPPYSAKPPWMKWNWMLAIVDEKPHVTFFSCWTLRQHIVQSTPTHIFFPSIDAAPLAQLHERTTPLHWRWEFLSLSFFQYVSLLSLHLWWPSRRATKQLLQPLHVHFISLLFFPFRVYLLSICVSIFILSMNCFVYYLLMIFLKSIWNFLG